MLPSCIFPKHQLSWSCRGRAPPAVGSVPQKSASTERIAGPLRALRDSGPSLRGARGFTPSRAEAHRAVAAAVSRHRFGANAGHCLRTRRFRSWPRRPKHGREVDDLMAGSRTPAAENCQAGARSAGYRRMKWLPTGARGAFGGQELSRWLDFLTRGLQPGVRAGSSGAQDRERGPRYGRLVCEQSYT